VVSSYVSCSSPTVFVTGHADRAGSEGYNVKLSERRAGTVKAYLSARNISGSIVTIAKGEGEPLVPTADGVPNEQNRRVQVVYEEEKKEVKAETPAPAAQPEAKLDPAVTEKK
jgi:outer membrane protein OmpA-like peptidoglycan-associated protein